MAEDDIYHSKRKYERFVEEYIINKGILKKPTEKRKYYCKNPANLKYYHKLIRRFEVDDLSYIRRLRLLSVMNMLCYFIECDLKDAGSFERDEVIIQIRKITSPSQLKKTQLEIKRIGKILFEDSEMPEFFKNFKIKVDISQIKARKDKLTYEEFEKLVKYFCDDPTMQAFLTITMETLARPQELLYTKIEDVELFDKYAIIHISEHGKEGIKKLLCIDSYPYLLKLLSAHRDPKNKKSYLFLNKEGKQLTPHSINKKLKRALKYLNIDKPITSYSIKRFGVTFRRLRGDDEVTIQKIAGWKSPQQLRVYDLSDQDDIFRIELAKRGLLKDENFNRFPKTRKCDFCGELVGFAETVCPKCKRLMDPNLVKKEFEEKEEIIKKLEFFSKFYERYKEKFDRILEEAKKSLS